MPAWVAQSYISTTITSHLHLARRFGFFVIKEGMNVELHGAKGRFGAALPRVRRFDGREPGIVQQGHRAVANGVLFVVVRHERRGDGVAAPLFRQLFAQGTLGAVPSVEAC